MMPERASRTFICSVLFLDIVGYSRKPVAEQIRLKDRFNGLIASAIREISPADRIILDTGDGVAISFLGDPEDALFVAMSLRDAFAPNPDEPPEVPARIGLNLGPVRLVRDLNGRPNIIGDGINVAQRVMAFASAGQILVSRSYFEIISHISEGYTKLFRYEGSRTDKHVREHEIYSVGYSTVEDALKSPAERARRGASETRNRAASGNASTARLLYHVENWLGNRTLAYGTAVFSSFAFVLALLTSFVGQSPHAGEGTRTDVQRTEVANTTVTAIGMVSDKEPELTTGKSAGALGDTAKANSEQQDSAADKPAPRPAKRKFHLPFFKPKAESGPEGDAAEDEQASTQPEESIASETANTGETDSATASAGALQQESEPAARNQPQSESTGRATVALAIAPWGEVYVDGKRIGVSPPLNEIELRTGRRVIEIRNGGFPPFKQSFELKAQQKIKIRYKFN